MIHPNTKLRFKNEEIGFGVFATEDIPMGTFIVVRDNFDRVISLEDFKRLDPLMQEKMESHMYVDKQGDLVLSWDNAKYLNHSCESNTMMTDYNIEIAVRDIKCGEEITSEYGLFNVLEPYQLHCQCTNCRKHLSFDDLDNYHKQWDEIIEASLRRSESVQQPLWQIMSDWQRQEMQELYKGKSEYRSVINIKWKSLS